MDKETLSNYGWVVIAVLVLSVMIALATPFGKYIATAVENTTEGLFNVQQKAMGSAGLEMMQQEFENQLNGNLNSESTVPLRFGEKYNWQNGYTATEITVSYEFSENGGVKTYVNDEFSESLPDGTLTYTADGVFYTDTGETFATFPYKDIPNGMQDAILIQEGYLAIPGNPIPIMWARNYYCEQYSSYTCAITATTIALELGERIILPIIFESYNTFSFDGGTGTISDDGSQITINGYIFSL